MRHLDEGTIHAWLDGALPPDEAEYAARHAAECSECAAAVADARGLIAGASRIVSSLDVVRGGVIPTQPVSAPGSRSLWRMLHLTPARAAIAATLLVAVGSTFVLSNRPERVMADSTAAAAPAPAAVVPEAAPVVQPTAPRRATSAPKRTEHEQPAVQEPAEIPPVAVAAAAPVVDSARVQPLADKTAAANSAAAMRSAFAAGAAGGAPRFAQSMGPTSVEGCYRLFVDSTSWLRALPERFALERDSMSGTPVVRSVTANGRMDTLVTGGRWRQMQPNLASVVFISQPSRMVTVQFSMSSSRARVSADGQTKDVALERTTCRP